MKHVVEEAIGVATAFHEGQVDKNGDVYILHPIRVMLRFTDPIERAAAVLHDVVEDTVLSLAYLKSHGFPERVVELVDLLTRMHGEKYMDYLERIATDPVAMRIKIADVEDNMPRPDRPLPDEYKGLRKRYKKSLQFLFERSEA
jgi:(p)ppGpp synthase/HD superfamily hydrolase